jgi:hypothetical protein
MFKSGRQASMREKMKYSAGFWDQIFVGTTAMDSLVINLLIKGQISVMRKGLPSQLCL